MIRLALLCAAVLLAIAAIFASTGYAGPYSPTRGVLAALSLIAA